MVNNRLDPDMHTIRRYLSGERHAFNELVKQYERFVYNLAYRMSGNGSDAADLTQEIFLHLHRKLPGFRGDSAFSTWLYRLAINYCKDWLRKESHRAETVEADETLLDGGMLPHQAYEQKEIETIVQKAILELPKDQRIVVILHDLNGYSYEEIADITESPVGTVKSRLARARLKLAEKLAPYGNSLRE
ncbi:MAG: sigma-70 family RNA polymerase sigma factor [Firmicutes bacterium]|nr:sigma-70 family RNA polymerase sigma factor [Bacillota bacterium]